MSTLLFLILTIIKQKLSAPSYVVGLAVDSLIEDGRAEFLIDETRQNSWITYMNITLKNILHTALPQIQPKNYGSSKKMTHLSQ